MARADKLPPADRWLVLGIQRYLAARDMTQAALADAVGGDPAYLSRVLKEDPKGRPEPRFKYLTKICGALGGNIIDVLVAGRQMADMYDTMELEAQAKARQRFELQGDTVALIDFLETLNHHQLELLDQHLKKKDKDSEAQHEHSGS